MPNGTILDNDKCQLSASPLPPPLLPVRDEQLTHSERATLWQIFQGINRTWSIGNEEEFRSAWLEFLEAKTNSSPDFTAEYSNAAAVMRELLDVYGSPRAFEMLFFNHGVPDEPPATRLAHAKVYVVDEFIRVQIVLGGFKSFVSEDEGDENRQSANYRGFVGGSRYNRVPVVRQLKQSS